MPRTCTICRHEQGQELDKALVAGESLRSIALRFDTSHMAVRRHKEHLSGKLVKAAERQEERHAVSLVDQLDARVKRLGELFDMVLPQEKDGQRGQIPRAHASVAVARELRESIRLVAQLTGQLKGDGATVNIGIGILASPEWGRVSSAVLGALLPYPDARAAVADALTRLSADSATRNRTEKPASLLGKPSPSPSGVPIASSGESSP